jgi:type 1 glutamine amidotransferase
MLGPDVPFCVGSSVHLNVGGNGDRQNRLLGLVLAMMRNLILSGGVAHDYAQTSPMLADVLVEAGIESEIHEDFCAVEDGSLLEYDLLTLNCVRWTCGQPEVNPTWREEWAFELSQDARDGFVSFFEAGKGLLALHCATICFDDWPEYREILGAWWEWGHSGHAPYQEHQMRVQTDAHPITEGIEDFAIVDELYTDPMIADSVSPLIEAEWEDTDHPILWVRRYGDARVCYNALGHGPEAFEHPANQTLLQRGALWAVGEMADGELAMV